MVDYKTKNKTNIKHLRQILLDDKSHKKHGVKKFDGQNVSFADLTYFLDLLSSDILSLHISQRVSDCLQSRSQKGRAEDSSEDEWVEAERSTTTGSRQAVVMLQPLHSWSSDSGLECHCSTLKKKYIFTYLTWFWRNHWNCRTFKSPSASPSCHEGIRCNPKYPMCQTARWGSSKPSSGNNLLTVLPVFFLHMAFSTKTLQQVWFWWGGKWWTAISKEQSSWLSDFGGRAINTHDSSRSPPLCWFFRGGTVSEPAELVQKLCILTSLCILSQCEWFLSEFFQLHLTVQELNVQIWMIFGVLMWPCNKLQNGSGCKNSLNFGKEWTIHHHHHHHLPRLI